MNGELAVLLDAYGAGLEWWLAVAASILAAIISGVVLIVIKQHFVSRDKAQRLQQRADDEERKRLETGIAALGLQIAAESEERRKAIAEESSVRREKDDALGREMVKGLNAIQNAFSYYCGKMDEKRPRFDD